VTWSSFYRTRQNPRYHAHVASRYAPLFHEVAQRSSGLVVEAGAGAGFSACALRPYLPPLTPLLLLERDADMIPLTQENAARLPETAVVQADVLTVPLPQASVTFAHGVLEHFEDAVIRRMVARQRRVSNWVIHYVPSAKYAAPSFGDERLLTPEQWKAIAAPSQILPFNDGYDLLLIWNGRT
jgi:hypothetical protein